MNAFHRLLADRATKTPIGTWVMSASPIVAEAVGTAGFDWGVLDMEHTPKNLLIRAVKRQEGSKKLPEELKACMEAYHVKPTLADLLTEKEEP